MGSNRRPRVEFFCTNEIREGEAHKECKWSFFGKITIKNPTSGDPYLTRYIIARTPFFRIFLHRFHQPDPDRDVHNHPWRALSVIIRGGYTELVVPDAIRDGRGVIASVRDQYAVTQWGRWWPKINQLKEHEYHRITDILPGTWTLVFGGPYFRDWGFLVDGEHIDWRTYLGVPSDTTLND